MRVWGGTVQPTAAHPLGPPNSHLSHNGIHPMSAPSTSSSTLIALAQWGQRAGSRERGPSAASALGPQWEPAPVSAGRTPRPSTPSSWRGRGVAGPPWGRRSGRPGSTGRSRSVSGPTTWQQLPGGVAVTGLEPQGVTWPLRLGSAPKPDPPPTRDRAAAKARVPLPGRVTGGMRVEQSTRGGPSGESVV